MMSGYCAIGITRRETSPAIVVTSAMTIASRGRSTKMAENIDLSRAPANGRWNGLFAWDEGCGGKYAGKIDADGGCCETGGLARAVEIGAARRSGPGAGDPRPAPGQALLTLEGRKAEEIAAVLGVHVSTVRNWRGLFV